MYIQRPDSGEILLGRTGWSIARASREWVVTEVDPIIESHEKSVRISIAPMRENMGGIRM